MFVEGVGALGATAPLTAPVQTPGEGPSTSIADWRAFVKSKGGVAVRQPSGALKGELAARYGTRYVIAPDAIRQLDQDERTADGEAIAAGARIDAVQSYAQQSAAVLKSEAASVASFAKGTVSTATDLAKTVAAAPRELIGSALGIPSWLVPALLIGGAVVAVKVLAPGFLPGVLQHHLSSRD